jgi:hypothetical protein
MFMSMYDPGILGWHAMCSPIQTSGMDCHCILALEGNYTLSGTTLKFADTHCVNGTSILPSLCLCR